MSKTKIVCPNCGAEFAIPATTHVALGVVLGADSNLGTIHPEVVGQSSDFRCADTHCNTRQPITSTSRNMKAEAKIEALRAAGVNVENLFSMKGANGQETIARLVNGNLEIVKDDDPIFAAILNGGTCLTLSSSVAGLWPRSFTCSLPVTSPEPFRRKAMPTSGR